MGDKPAPLDLRISRIAARQHGLVTHRQLLGLGMSRNAISARVRRGALHRLHRGVYAVGATPTAIESRWMAAVLACGGDAALSHRSAAALWGLLRPVGGRVDVAARGRSGRDRRSGIRVHRPRSLGAGEVTMRRGIPVTSPARTIADLRPVAPAWEWRRAVRQAEFLGLPLGPEVESDGTRSDLERDFLRLCRRHGIPAPEVNVRVAEVDCRLPLARAAPGCRDRPLRLPPRARRLSGRSARAGPAQARLRSAPLQRRAGERMPFRGSG